MTTGELDELVAYFDEDMGVGFQALFSTCVKLDLYNNIFMYDTGTMLFERMKYYFKYTPKLSSSLSVTDRLNLLHSWFAEAQSRL